MVSVACTCCARNLSYMSPTRFGDNRARAVCRQQARGGRSPPKKLKKSVLVKTGSPACCIEECLSMSLCTAFAATARSCAKGDQHFLTSSSGWCVKLKLLALARCPPAAAVRKEKATPPDNSGLSSSMVPCDSLSSEAVAFALRFTSGGGGGGGLSAPTFTLTFGAEVMCVAGARPVSMMALPALCAWVMTSCRASMLRPAACSARVVAK
mmetsp:Transcript_43367/g.102113  ORF Transcript_43367/g.102113 Transcript_43367/m.102113 type:complete len:210 (-) Transcript_43367:1439-2068(-)